MVSTYTTTFTITHTATYLADILMSTFAEVLASLGIDSSSLYRDWDQDESAIRAWIAERSLDSVQLECHRPSGVVDPIFVFPVRYEPVGTGDERFVRDGAATARYLAKLKSVPTGTTFRLFCKFRTARSPQPGWGPGTSASTDGLRSRTIGTIGGGPHASASAQVYTS